MNEKALFIAIVTLLAIGFISVLFIAVPSFTTGLSNWKDVLTEDIIILIAILLFVYGFYMNTKM